MKVILVFISLATVSGALPGCQLDERDLGIGPSAHRVAPSAEGPLFLVHSAVQNLETRTNYFSLVEQLGATVRLDHTRSLELPGRARLYADRGTGFLAVGDGETPVITRYELGADGWLHKKRAISLQPQGVTALGAQAVLFVGPDKAYYKDPGQSQIVVWNPADMSVQRSIPLPADLLSAGHLSSFSQWASRTGEAYFAVSWTSKQYDRVRAGTALVRIDTTTDAITVTRDGRCRGLGKTAQLGGALYFFSDVINAFGHAVSPHDAGQPDCIVRVSPGRTTFDPDYLGSIAPALSGRQIGTVVAVTTDGRAWAQVVDLGIAATAPGTTYLEWYARGWRWAHLDLASRSRLTLVSAEPGAYAGNAFVVGPDLFISQASSDYADTTLVNLSPPAAAPGLSFPGFALDVARVR